MDFFGDLFFRSRFRIFLFFSEDFDHFFLVSKRIFVDLIYQLKAFRG
nr:MAG TPA: hypothetical protein [Caudoviricetes sp.]